ncbi:hypothetical protein [Roseibacillus ishigakijimensis]|uniref:Matrixin n=1 Tax=Roseibacillus ishigakijimensis TaxID=454146 RepID=A0A934RRP0_9BACT|nr:hypothetical protein [Roseibacillus ishigakijimensis]MBK1834401.1 hypothetical protein [Roseibacillus ishigakijimensis]
MKTLARWIIATTLFVGSPLLPALEFEFRYDLDHSGFFDNPEARECLEAAGAFFAELISDHLEPIDPLGFHPGTSYRWYPTYLEPDSGSQQRATASSQLQVAADTLVIFVGGRDLSKYGVYTSAVGGPGGIEFATPANMEWFDHLLNRGEAGAVHFEGQSYSSNPTDFAPWGGAIFFNSAREWNFSTTDAEASEGVDFLSIALHELIHVLGIGNTSPLSSWSPLVKNGHFQGPLATISNTGTPPICTGDKLHWSAQIEENHTAEAFGLPQAQPQEPLMTPATGTTRSANFEIPTDLDLAALQDIGWEMDFSNKTVAPEVVFEGGLPCLAIPTITGLRYEVERAPSPDELAPLGAALEGDGSVQVWEDEQPLPGKAFYRIAITASEKRALPTAKKAPSSAPPEEYPGGLPAALPASDCACSHP